MDLNENQLFSATDKLNRTINYKFLLRTNEKGCRYIKLLNLDNNTLTEVESEWFNQRKIIMKEVL